VGWFLAIRGVLLLTVPSAYDAAGNALYSSGATPVIWVVFICLRGRALPDLRRLEAGTAHTEGPGERNPRSPGCRE
jgi:hypothetical protein